MSTETIRFALIGKQDLRIGTGKFEVTLADGRKALLDEVNLADLISPLTANIDGDDFGIYDLGFLSIGNARLGTTAPLDVGDTDTRTNTVKIAAAFWANTTGVPAAEIGTAIKLQAESADEDPSDALEIQGVLTTITAGAENSDLRVLLRSAGAALAEKFRLKGSGAAILGAAANPDAAALLELQTTTKGFLLPRMTTTQKNAIAAPPAGLIVYDSTLGKQSVYDGSTWNNLGVATAVYTDELTGLALSKNGVDATNDLDIALGAAASDDAAIADRVLMSLTAGLTKQLDAPWAVGTNAGGRMSAAAIANTTYHVFLIERVDTGVVDVGFDVSATAPTLPTNYTKARRIGSMVRAGGTILAFIQDGEFFQLSTPVLDIDVLNPGTAAVTRTLASVPIGVSMRAVFLAIYGDTSTQVGKMYFSDLATTDLAPSTTVAPLYALGNNTVSNDLPAGQFMVRTNTSAQIRSRASASAAASALRIATLGWFDRRGRG